MIMTTISIIIMMIILTRRLAEGCMVPLNHDHLYHQNYHGNHHNNYHDYPDQEVGGELDGALATSVTEPLPGAPVVRLCSSASTCANTTAVLVVRLCSSAIVLVVLYNY